MNQARRFVLPTEFLCVSFFGAWKPSEAEHELAAEAPQTNEKSRKLIIIFVFFFFFQNLFLLFQR